MAQFPQVGGVITKRWPRLRLCDGDSFPVARDTCAVCCGVYADDVEEETGEVIADWIQCTEEQCPAWTNVDCLEMEAGLFVILPQTLVN